MFHQPHFTIPKTNNCGKTRYVAFEKKKMFMDVKSHRDYAERLTFKVFNTIQSEYYDSNWSFSKGVIALDNFKYK